VVSVVVVSMGVVLAVAVSMGVAFAVAAAISVQCQVDTRSPAAELVRGVAAIGVGATGTAIGAIIDSLMMSSSSATLAFRRGGAGTIRTDITVTTITRTIPMGTAGIEPVGTVTTITEATDTAMAADQGICGVCGIGDRRGLRCGQVISPSKIDNCICRLSRERHEHDLDRDSMPPCHSRRRHALRLRRRIVAEEMAARPRARLEEVISES
jgi:hypothetical protein